MPNNAVHAIVKIAGERKEERRKGEQRSAGGEVLVLRAGNDHDQ